MSGAVGPGTVSWIAQWIGETSETGCRGVRRGWCRGSRAPPGRARDGASDRWLTRLIPSLRLIRSAGVSRIARATNGSSRALPPRPRLTRSRPHQAGRDDRPRLGRVGRDGAVADRAAVVHPPAAGRPDGGASGRRCAGRRARSARRGAARSRRPCRPAGAGSSRVVAAPAVKVLAPVIMSTSSTLPPGPAVARGARRRRARRTTRPVAAVHRRSDAWWAGRRAPAGWRRSGGRVVRRRAGPRRGAAGGRRSGRRAHAGSRWGSRPCSVRSSSSAPTTRVGSIIGLSQEWRTASRPSRMRCHVSSDVGAVGSGRGRTRRRRRVRHSRGRWHRGGVRRASRRPRRERVAAQGARLSSACRGPALAAAVAAVERQPGRGIAAGVLDGVGPPHPAHGGERRAAAAPRRARTSPVRGLLQGQEGDPGADVGRAADVGVEAGRRDAEDRRERGQRDLLEADPVGEIGGCGRDAVAGESGSHPDSLPTD